MKFFTFFLLFFYISSHGKGFAQQVSLSHKNVRLEIIFKEITDLVNKEFLSSPDMITFGGQKSEKTQKPGIMSIMLKRI